MDEELFCFGAQAAPGLHACRRDSSPSSSWISLLLVCSRLLAAVAWLLCSPRLAVNLHGVAVRDVDEYVLKLSVAKAPYIEEGCPATLAEL